MEQRIILRAVLTSIILVIFLGRNVEFRSVLYICRFYSNLNNGRFTRVYRVNILDVNSIYRLYDNRELQVRISELRQELEETQEIKEPGNVLK